MNKQDVIDIIEDNIEIELSVDDSFNISGDTTRITCSLIVSGDVVSESEIEIQLN